MGTRGRESAASIATSNVVALRQPAPAPACLTPVQAAKWDEIIRSSAGNLISDEAFPVLIEYCRAIEASDQCAKKLEALDPSSKDEADFKRWLRLQTMQNRLSARVASLAVKLRITPSTRWQPASAARNAARTSGKPKPWET